MFDKEFANREEMGCQAYNSRVSEQEFVFMCNTFLVITVKKWLKSVFISIIC